MKTNFSHPHMQTKDVDPIRGFNIWTKLSQTGEIKKHKQGESRWNKIYSFLYYIITEK